MDIRTQKESDYCDVYAELKSVLGNDESVYRIFEHYNGLTVAFPKKLYSKQYIHDYIMANYEREKIQDIARKLNLSERRIRQLASEIRSGGDTEDTERG